MNNPPIEENHFDDYQEPNNNNDGFNSQDQLDYNPENQNFDQPPNQDNQYEEPLKNIQEPQQPQNPSFQPISDYLINRQPRSQNYQPPQQKQPTQNNYNPIYLSPPKLNPNNYIQPPQTFSPNHQAGKTFQPITLPIPSQNYQIRPVQPLYQSRSTSQTPTIYRPIQNFSPQRQVSQYSNPSQVPQFIPQGQLFQQPIVSPLQRTQGLVYPQNPQFQQPQQITRSVSASSRFVVQGQPHAPFYPGVQQPRPQQILQTPQKKQAAVQNQLKQPDAQSKPVTGFFDNIMQGLDTLFQPFRDQKKPEQQEKPKTNQNPSLPQNLLQTPKNQPPFQRLPQHSPISNTRILPQWNPNNLNQTPQNIRNVLRSPIRQNPVPGQIQPQQINNYPQPLAQTRNPQIVQQTQKQVFANPITNSYARNTMSPSTRIVQNPQNFQNPTRFVQTPTQNGFNQQQKPLNQNPNRNPQNQTNNNQPNQNNFAGLTNQFQQFINKF